MDSASWRTSFWVLRCWLACSSSRRRRPSRRAQPSASADSGFSSIWGLDAARMPVTFVPQNGGQIKAPVDVEDPETAWYSAVGPVYFGAVARRQFPDEAQYEVR